MDTPDLKWLASAPLRRLGDCRVYSAIGMQLSTNR